VIWQQSTVASPFEKELDLESKINLYLVLMLRSIRMVQLFYSIFDSVF
jgi:hypothetical protein